MRRAPPWRRAQGHRWSGAPGGGRRRNPLCIAAFVEIIRGQPTPRGATMNALLNSWGLDGVPYLERALQAGLRITVMLLLSWLVWRVATRLIGLVRLRLLTRSAASDDIKRIHTMTQVSRYAVGVVVTLVTGMV